MDELDITGALVETKTRMGRASAPPRLPFTRADIEQTVPERFDQVVERFPDYVALTGRGKSWTYRDLARRVNAIAHAIMAQVPTGAGCVAYLIDQSPEMVIATLSVLKAGKTYLAIHPGTPPARQREILRDVMPQLVLITTAQEPRARELAEGVCCVLRLEDVSQFVYTAPQLAARPQHPSTLFYTSGTTGQPKGVVKSHRAVLHRIWLAVEHDRVGPGDRQSLLTHCAFSASEVDMFGALLNGATLCVFDFAAEGMAAFREWLAAERITLLHPPVLLFRRFLASLTPADRFPEVRLVALAGDAVLPADVAAWRDHFDAPGVLMHRFSITETGLISLARIERDAASDDTVLAGWPLEDKEISLVDEAGRPVAPGEAGEIVVTSPFIAEGYWGRRNETESAFRTDPAVSERRSYRTSDLGRFLPDGRLVFLGRRDRQVKIRGFRVELAEIEAALAHHPNVAESVVVVQDHDDGDRRLVAYVVARRLPVPSGSDLLRFLRDRLPPYMMPAAFGFLDALPMTPTGKIDLQALPELDEPDQLSAEYVKPTNDRERELVLIWQQLLGIDRIGVRDNFFDLGGHSLIAAQLFTQVEERLGVRLPLATLFRTPTIEGLAASIWQGADSATWRSLVAIRPTGSRAPLFAVPGLDGNVLSFNDLADTLGSDQPIYGLQSRGLGGTEDPLGAVEEIATEYLREIREVQPNGPYHLMGVCMGAKVVFELAQQLRAAGEAVGLLALVEPRPPVVTVRRTRVRLAPRAVALVWMVAGRLKLYAETFGKLPGRQRLDFLRDRLTMVKEMFARRDPFRGNRTEFNLQVVRQANRDAVHRYLPKPYDGHVDLFLAEERAVDRPDRRLDWQQLALGGIEVFYVPGNDSGSAMARPNVDVLTPLLRAALERAQGATPPRLERPGPPQVALAEPASRPLSSSFETVADAFLAQLVDHDVKYVFINPGSDIAPIQESIAKFHAEGRPAPKLVLCLHESVALAAAHGYFMLTGKPQVVLVHADVGTQNLGANLHNAQRGHAGVVICAGAPPGNGAVGSGARTRQMDWIQDQYDQAGIVAGYVKWHHRLTDAGNLDHAVRRAFRLAGAAPAAPVYLILPKDVLLAKADRRSPEAGRAALPAPPAPDPASVARAAEWLVAAERPLILVAHAGTNPRAVEHLRDLAERLAIPVVESRNRINFPASHPLHLGFCALPYMAEADCLLVVDHDSPWVPSQGQPAPNCRIIHLDLDPLKLDMPTWGFAVDLAIQADTAQALGALSAEVERRVGASDRARVETRRRAVTAEHEVQRAGWRQRAAELRARQPIAPEWAAHCLNDLLDDTTMVVSEAVSNNPVLWHHLELDAPATYYQSMGSGLGWGLGAALGAKLAAPEKTVLCVVGDGTWIFGSPLAAYWAAERHRSPFLTVIFNNQIYAETVAAIRSVAPDGYANATGRFPACELPKPPLYSKMAEAMGLWAATVTDPQELPGVLRRALAEVRAGRSALVDIVVSSSQAYGATPDV